MVQTQEKRLQVHSHNTTAANMNTVIADKLRASGLGAALAACSCCLADPTVAVDAPEAEAGAGGGKCRSLFTKC